MLPRGTTEQSWNRYVLSGNVKENPVFLPSDACLFLDFWEDKAINVVGGNHSSFFFFFPRRL